MSGIATLVRDTDEMAEVLNGAVDLYIHPSPELLPRDIDVVALARQMKDDGFASAMLWNQFSPTAELATVVTGVTGFQLYGSIILNGTVGGVSPRVVEHSLKMGAKYVSMPSLSGSAAYLNDAATGPGYANEAMRIAGPVAVTDDSGALLPDVLEIIDLVKTYDVALGLGYLVYDEAIAVLNAARDAGVKRIGVLRPLAGLGFTKEQLAIAMEVPGTLIQIPASSLRTPVSSDPARLPSYEDFAKEIHPDTEAFVEAIRTYGAQRCVLTTDTGWNDATAMQWLELGAESLAQFGITKEELRIMVHDTPAELINI